jgi:hypothetical protein
MKIRPTAFIVVAAAVVASPTLAQSALSLKVLKVEKRERTSFLLMQVTNLSEQRFVSTRWSCAFYKSGQPVHEESNIVENVPPRGTALKREIQDYADFDGVDCRLISSVPSTCP